MSITRTGCRRSLGLLLVALAATGALSGCPRGSASAYDDIARNLLKMRGGTGAVDEVAVVRRLETELNPSISTVAREEQSSVYDDACQIKNWYDAGKISSVEEGADWLETQGGSSRARANAVRQLAEKLIKLNKDPSLVDSIEISGDTVCLAS